MKVWTDQVSYSFNLKAYPESIPDKITKIISSFTDLVQYAYILHDKDIDENGDLKKPHYHIYLKFAKRYRYQTIAKKFGVACNNELIQCAKDWKRLVRYFVHLDDVEKYQYPDTELFTANIDRESVLAVNYMDKEDKERKDFQTILEFIAVEEPTLWKLISFVLENDMIATYRRCYPIFKDLINEMREK